MAAMEWMASAACRGVDGDIFFADDDEPRDWRDQALCAEVDVGLFFPEAGESAREAKMVCRRCEVSEACLAYALEHGEQHGVWGGLSPKERQALRRQQAREAA